jgi:hypothetical protein
MAVTAPTAATRTRTRTEKGISLARGPALILGTIGLVAGLYFLYKQHTFPQLSNFPKGSAPVQSKVLFGIFGANGWTGMLLAVAGGLLLFGAAQHLLAKTMSLIVGVALGAAAVIALISGDVLGLAAANHMTELLWAVAAAILLLNVFVPRRRREITVAAPVDTREEPVATRAEPVTAGSEPVTAREERVAAHEEPVAAREEPVAADDGETTVVRERTTTD